MCELWYFPLFVDQKQGLTINESIAVDSSFSPPLTNFSASSLMNFVIMQMTFLNMNSVGYNDNKYSPSSLINFNRSLNSKNKHVLVKISLTELFYIGSN